LLARTVVVGHHDERGIGARTLREGCQPDRLLKIVRPGSSHDRYPAARGVDCCLDDILALFEGKGRGLAGRTSHRDPVTATLDLPLDKVAEGRFIKLAILERSHQRDD